MQDGALLTEVALLQGEAHLKEDFPNNVLLDATLLPPAFFYVDSEVATSAVLHHDVDLGSGLVDYTVVVTHNVRVTELAEDVYLRGEKDGLRLEP